ncbi:phage tail protein [Xenorhabdus hominickii]|uniref:Phage tail protein n=1 Tax=Xenorhabdus hominickii TaxID=351679 RepID=A0ABM6DXQ7_XENHO|nr:phage tail protein [Xenorhabdus hominickii]
MTLALRLGKTLTELQNGLSASELMLWRAYDRINPLSDRRGDIQAAQIASAVYQSQGAKISLSDALLEWGNPDEDKQGDFENFFMNLA